MIGRDRFRACCVDFREMNKKRIEKLEREGYLEKKEWMHMFSSFTEEDRIYAAKKAREISRCYFENRIFIRGLIEFTNYCKNNCYYCGIRRENDKAVRYRLTKEDILSCCEKGYGMGFRTFVLQGGEDAYNTDAYVVQLIRAVKDEFPDCALTLSIGEKEPDSYRCYFEAGADRYLLRHETADEMHYKYLHPESMSFAHRIDCLKNLKEIGFQTGCGFMVGSPGQSEETLAEDMEFIHRLHPQMVGIGPFIPHKDTPFCREKKGSLKLTLFLISLLRIMEKNVLLPATTALGTIHAKGREMGILAGANVVMPNLSPGNVRQKYCLYDNKACQGAEGAEGIAQLKDSLQSIGYEAVCDRGDWKKRQR